MATFGGASDAVAAAVAIQQAIGRHNRSAASDVLAVRIGISAGDVIFEGDDCFGTPVIEAARLCAAAGGGQILASEMVRWLARSGASTTFTPVGTLELKGLPEPVPAVRGRLGAAPGVRQFRSRRSSPTSGASSSAETTSSTAGAAVEGSGGRRAAGRPPGRRAGRGQDPPGRRARREGSR